MQDKQLPGACLGFEVLESKGAYMCTWYVPPLYAYTDIVVSLDPNIDSSLFQGPQKGTPNFGKPAYLHTHIYIYMHTYLLSMHRRPLKSKGPCCKRGPDFQT